MRNVLLLFYLCVAFLLSGCALLGNIATPEETIRFIVLDGGRQPVYGAMVSMTWETGAKVSSFTDENGVAVLTASGRGVLWVSADKEGYYRTAGEIFSSSFTYSELAEKEGVRIHFDPLYMRGGMYRTRPPEEIYVVLKKVKNQVPMYVRRIKRSLPVLEERVGFDFEIGDWVEPYGKGRVSDFIFEGIKREDAWDDYEMNLILSFSNASDGIMAMKVPEYRLLYSHLLSPTVAPTVGYKKEMSFFSKSVPGQQIVLPDWENEISLFRIRSETNFSGEIISANYGKIYNGIKCFPEKNGTISIHFDYYFNPILNSRTLEYNGENLFKKTESTPSRYAP